MGSFAEYILLKEGSRRKKAPQPVQMPKEDSNKIKIKEPKDRIPGGRRDTTFRGEKEKKTRDEERSRAIKEFD